MTVNLQKTSVAIALILLVFTTLLAKWWPQSPVHFVVNGVKTTNKPAQYHEQFLSFGETIAVHAPAITQRADGKLIAVWYAGTREGAKDVEILSTLINPEDFTISPARSIASARQTEKDSWRYIRKLGNPIIHALPDGRLMLVYVSVSFGGWAASSLNIRFSNDDGTSWTAARKLVTSPSMNISTLVKGTPINYDNGDIGLPVYHEFMGKFAELLILDNEGNIKNKRRISWGRDAIQPVIIPLGESQAISLLRDSGEIEKRIGFSHTDDTGENWTTPTPLPLPNPNAAVAASHVRQQELIQVFNNDEDERFDLTLAYSADGGQSWKIIHQFEKEPLIEGKKIEFSYPYLIRDNSDGYHLVYTWHKKRIKYIHFNQAWLEQKL